MKNSSIIVLLEEIGLRKTIVRTGVFSNKWESCSESRTLSAAESKKKFGEAIAVESSRSNSNTMGQEVSVSYQAVKSKVYRLIDSLVEDVKNTGDVQESMKRWWKLIHPADRPIARKHLLSVLAKSNATLEAICDGLTDMKDFELHQMPQNMPRLHTLPSEPVQRMKASV